jgi:hypothetical protein
MPHHHGIHPSILIGIGGERCSFFLERCQTFSKSTEMENGIEVADSLVGGVAR